MEIWIGSRYAESTHRILILGESAYGTSRLEDWTNEWIGGAGDRTFTRIFNTISSTHALNTRMDQRREVWSTIVFYNFVVEHVVTAENRPTEEQYKASIPQFRDVLEEHQPSGVWVLGKEQAKYSEPVIRSLKLPFEVSCHPTSYGLSNKSLKESWVKLQKKLNDT